MSEESVVARETYIKEFQMAMREKMTQSLQSVINRIKDFNVDGNGFGLRGEVLSEMLHHCEWAHKKCETFFGREVLIRELMEYISPTDESIKRTGKFGGISAAVIGVSGAGKTALMAKVGSLIHRQSSDIPVLIRFCGTSPGSQNARSLVTSICAQIEFLFDLEQKAKSFADKNTMRLSSTSILFYRIIQSFSSLTH